MRGFLLFTKTRHWQISVVIIIVAVALIYLFGNLTFTYLPRGTFYLSVAGQIPVVIAVVIQATLNPGLNMENQATVRRLPLLRLIHVLSLTLFAAILIILVGRFSDTSAPSFLDITTIAVIRNLLALTGISLVGLIIIPSSFGWVLPLSWLILPYLFFARPDQDRLGILTLTSQNGTNLLVLIVACLVWIGGCVVAIFDWRILPRLTKE